PELQAMLAYCRKHPGWIHFLVVYSIDRLARDQFDHAILRRHFAALGITFRSVSQPIDDSPTGRLMEGVLSAFAQFDNDQKAVKVKASMRAALESGRWMFQAPVGYLSASIGGRRTLIPDPERASLVAKAFELVASGLCSRTQALKTVTELGLLTRRGRALTPQTFSKVLCHPLYAGRVRAPKFQIDTAASFPALISEETFWKAQGATEGTVPVVIARERRRPEFPLRGFIRCERCGRPLTASFSRGKMGATYAYYHCPPAARCRAVNVS